MRSLKKQNILITGGAKRLGKAAALALAKKEANIILHYNQSAQEAEEVALEITKAGGSCRPVCFDFSKTEKITPFILQQIETYGPIDALVNSASIFPADSWQDLSADSLSLNMNVNALAPFLLGKGIASQDRETDIINFLDTRIVGPDHLHAAYHLSKRTFFSLTRVMSEIYAPRTRVNAIAPGLILPPEGQGQEFLEKRKESNLLQTYGSTEDINEALIFLLESKFITGQIIFVDGGRHILGNRYGV